MLKYLVVFNLINPLTALNLQRAGLGVQREAAEVHVAHGSDSDPAGETAVTQRKTYTAIQLPQVTARVKGEFTNDE